MIEAKTCSGEGRRTAAQPDMGVVGAILAANLRAGFGRGGSARIRAVRGGRSGGRHVRRREALATAPRQMAESRAASGDATGVGVDHGHSVFGQSPSASATGAAKMLEKG